MKVSAAHENLNYDLATTIFKKETCALDDVIKAHQDHFANRILWHHYYHLQANIGSSNQEVKVALQNIKVWCAKICDDSQYQSSTGNGDKNGYPDANTTVIVDTDDSISEEQEEQEEDEEEEIEYRNLSKKEKELQNEIFEASVVEELISIFGKGKSHFKPKSDYLLWSEKSFEPSSDTLPQMLQRRDWNQIGSFFFELGTCFSHQQSNSRALSCFARGHAVVCKAREEIDKRWLNITQIQSDVELSLYRFTIVDGPLNLWRCSQQCTKLSIPTRAYRLLHRASVECNDGITRVRSAMQLLKSISTKDTQWWNETLNQVLTIKRRVHIDLGLCLHGLVDHINSIHHPNAWRSGVLLAATQFNKVLDKSLLPQRTDTAYQSTRMNLGDVDSNACKALINMGNLFHDVGKIAAAELCARTAFRSAILLKRNISSADKDDDATIESVSGIISCALNAIARCLERRHMFRGAVLCYLVDIEVS